MAWIAWLALVCAMTMFAVALPLAVRVAVCAIVAAAGAWTLCWFILLRGARGVRVIEWTGSGLTLRVGPRLQPLSATLNRGSFRPGRHWLALTFDTPAGRRQLLIDGRYQETRAFRRLCREYSRGLKGGAGRDSRTS